MGFSKPPSRAQASISIVLMGVFNIRKSARPGRSYTFIQIMQSSEDVERDVSLVESPGPEIGQGYGAVLDVL